MTGVSDAGVGHQVGMCCVTGEDLLCNRFDAVQQARKCGATGRDMRCDRCAM